MLGAAVLLALATSGAEAANRVDLHQRNVNQLRQQYQSLTATQGVATMANRRHAQFMRADADRKSTRLNSSHLKLSRMPSSA